MTERLSWASGSDVREGWHHSDVQWYSGMQTDHAGARDHLGPIQSGLPWDSDTFDLVVSHHGLMMLTEAELVPALVELRRVTKPGGWLRVSVPDIWSAVWAMRDGNLNWFPLEAADVDEAFCRYVTQNGATRSIFTYNRLHRLIAAAGWNPRASSWRATYSPFPEIIELDSRPNESIYMEAVKPA